MVATAAALARDDEKIFHTLPEITGPRYEVVMQAAQRNMYDRGCSAVGAKNALLSVQRTPLRLWKSWKQWKQPLTALGYILNGGTNSE